MERQPNRRIYEILRIRRLEEEIVNRLKEKKMRCPMHFCMGQEGIAVGVCSQLERSDLVISHHRSHGHYLAKGGDLKKMVAELYGKETGCSHGRGGSMHLVDTDVGFMGTTGIPGNCIPVGVGLALALKLKNSSHLTAIFFGEGGAQEGAFSESLHIASLKQLPVLFICENNAPKIDALQTHAPSTSRVKIAENYGLLAARENGNDIEKVEALVKKGVQSIKKDSKPTFLEFETSRFYTTKGGDHTEKSSDWKESCPLEIYANRLIERGELSFDTMRVIEEEVRKEIDAAFAYAEESAYPEYDSTFEEVYAPTPRKNLGEL